MPSEFYKPIGQLMTSGSSINGKDAFIKPIPLRANKSGKDGNKSPLTKPDKAQLPPKGRKAEIKQDLQLRGQGGGGPAAKQKKLQEQTTEPGSSSTTTSDTTTTKPDSTTTKQQTTREKSTTSSEQTMPRNTRSNRGNQDRRGNNGRTGGDGSRKGDNPFFTSSNYTETKTPFNTYTKGVDSASFVVDGLEGPLNWSTALESTCLLRPEIMSYDLTTGEVQAKFIIVGSSFGDALSNASTNNVKLYDTFLTLLFNRYQVDILRYTKGVVPSFWTAGNFRTAMKTMIKALEYYYTLDSILSFANKGVANFSGSRTLENYALPYNSATILVSRDNLRKTFQGMWCPPNLAMFLRGYFQYYRTSDKAGQAQIFRYAPSTDFIASQNSISTITSNVQNSISTLISLMSDSTTLSVLGVLANLYPDGIINGMPKSADDAHYIYDMVEMLLNEPLICNDINATNALSVQPLAYFDNNNDIPYYSTLNPKEMSGMPYALQTICTTATSINSGNVWAAQTNYYGLRCPVIQGAAPNQSNKFLYDSVNTVCTPLKQSNLHLLFGTNCHLITSVWNGTTNVSKFFSAPVYGAQRVHFDQYNAPGTYFNIEIGRAHV